MQEDLGGQSDAHSCQEERNRVGKVSPTSDRSKRILHTVDFESALSSRPGVLSPDETVSEENLIMSTHKVKGESISLQKQS